MTAVSLINPYAPQPAAGIGADAAYSNLPLALPAQNAASTTDMGNSSQHSGQGTGNGTGTGGAQVSMLLKKGRAEMSVQRATPESIVEAQSEADPATEFLERQARLQVEAKAAEERRAAARAEARAAAAEDEASRAAQPEYVMPNPLPTAPILERSQD